MSVPSCSPIAMNDTAKPQETPSRRATVRNLGHRLDALALALQTLEADPQTAEAARRLVGSIRASSELHGMRAIADAAHRAESADPSELTTRLRELMTLLRFEITRQGLDRQTTLIVSADAALVQALSAALEARARRVVIAASATHAGQILGTQDIASVVVDSVLPGQDGRALIMELRSRPATAALPVVAVSSPRSAPLQDQDLVQAADARYEKPVNPDEVADFLVFRLKRGYERGRESRRDPLTGLLNRAAFCATYTQMVAQRPDATEPMTVVMLGISHFDTLAESCGPVVRDELIRQVGAILSASFRSTDVVARWGVSEFSVILPGEDHYGGTRAIEKVLSVLNRQKVVTPAGKPLPVAVCAGLTVITGTPTVDEAMERADHFLYAAYYISANGTAAPPIVSDATEAVRRTDRVAICLADGRVCRVMVPLLERDNIDAICYASADEAIRELPRHTVHLVVLDDEMPDDGAFKVLQAIRAQPKFNRVAVVMLVGGEASIVRALQLGANDYAVKPFPPSAFLARVRRILRHGAKAPDRAQLTVLVVDHDVPQLLIAGTALHQKGCRVLLAKGARDGLRRLAEALPDVLVLDLDMPGFTGNDFLKMIPLLPKLRKLAVVGASEAAQDPASLSSKVFSIRGHVTRPYKPGTFLEQMRPLLGLPASDADEAQMDAEPIEAEIQRILSLRP